MEVLQINNTDKELIEKVITKIAEQYDIKNVASVSVGMTSEGSVVHFKQKEAIFDMLADAAMSPAKPAFKLVSMLMQGLQTITTDPELQEIAEQIVQNEIAQPGSQIAPNEKGKFVNMILGIVTTGAKKLVDRFKAEQAKHQKEWDQWYQQAEGSFKDEREKLGEGGFLETAGNWLADLDANVSSKVENLFSGPSRQDLVNRLVEVASTKAGVPKAYVPQFVEYINSALDQGIGQMKQTLEQKEQQGQQEQQGKYPGNPTYERDPSTNQPTTYNRADGGKAYKVNYDPSSGKKSIYVTVEPPNKLVPDNQIVQQDAQQQAPAETDPNAAQEAQPPQQMQQPDMNTTQPMQAAARAEALMHKEAGIGAILKGVARYAPELITLAKILYDMWKKRKTAVDDFLGRKAEIEEKENVIQGMIDTALGIINNIKSGLESELSDEMIQALKKWDLDLVASKDKLIELLEILIDVLRTMQGDSVEVAPDENSIDDSIIDAEYTVEADYLKVNSETFSVRAGSSCYQELETLMRKVAEQEGVDGISVIEVEITKDTGEIVFRQAKVAAFNNLVPALGSFAVSRWYGDKQSIPESVLHGVGGAMTNMGYPIGVAIAKTLGFGFLGQAAAGGLASLATAFFMGKGSDNPSENRSYQERLKIFTESVAKGTILPQTAVSIISENTRKQPEEISEDLIRAVAEYKESQNQ